MNKKFLLLLYVLHIAPIQASDQSTFDRYKIASLSIALRSSVGVCLAHLLKADLDEQHLRAKAALPQTPEAYSAALNAKRKEQKGLLKAQTAYTHIYRLSNIVLQQHATQQKPSRGRRLRACKKMQQLAPDCPEVAMVATKLAKHDTECDRNCEDPENWNAHKGSRYPCHRIRSPHAEFQHVVANENLILTRNLKSVSAEIATLTAQKPQYQAGEKLEAQKRMLHAAKISLKTTAVASLGALGIMQFRRS